MIRPRKYKKAFTIMEMLISLAIMAMLLAAIAAAVHASLMSYKENDELAAAMQTVRTVLNRLTREVRTAEAVDATFSSVTVIPPEPDPDQVDEIHYEYTGGQLIYRVTKDGTPTNYVLISNSDDVQIIGFAVEQELGLNWLDEQCTKSITVRIVVQIEGKSFGMTASAAPRRNQTY